MASSRTLTYSTIMSGGARNKEVMSQAVRKWVYKARALLTLPPGSRKPIGLIEEVSDCTLMLEGARRIDFLAAI